MLVLNITVKSVALVSTIVVPGVILVPSIKFPGLRSATLLTYKIVSLLAESIVTNVEVVNVLELVDCINVN